MPWPVFWCKDKIRFTFSASRSPRSQGVWVNQRPGIRNHAGVIAIGMGDQFSATQGESGDFGEGHSEETSEVPLFKKIAIW